MLLLAPISRNCVYLHSQRTVEPISLFLHQPLTPSCPVILTRLSLVGGAQVIGGGLPVGAYGGRKDIMEMVAPAGPMYQAGTLSGNPLAMTVSVFFWLFDNFAMAFECSRLCFM